jgi:predicted PhzF superfamily epimerase YddE/YHI9
MTHPSSTEPGSLQAPRMQVLPVTGLCTGTRARESLEPHPHVGGTIVSAPGEYGVDYVCRFFPPSVGIDEDPATGSIHCTLVPYWANRLGKWSLRARQLSARGGDFHCKLAGDRVKIAGEARLYLQGTLEL